MKLIGVDIGGTFTDVVFADSETNDIRVHKVPTTPEDPSLGMQAAVRELCERERLSPAEVGHLFHGTTIATNAVLTHDGARTGMITSAGYRDIVHIGRHQRPQHYSIRQEIPWQDRPFVRRRHRLTVPERITPPAGEVLVPLDEEAVRDAARRLRDEGVEAIAVCFLFSWVDPAHEERAAAIVREEHPACFVTTSASVSPQFREFERFTTTAMNAFIGPRVRDYMNRIGARMADAGIAAELHVMASNGGVATVRTVSERPVVTLLSGPAAGVLGGRWSGELSGRRRLITFDMGGTSADIGIVDEGRFAEATARDTWVAGYPVLVSMIDIHTIGAGGGSIARVDQGGGFRVGPESAGAVPGPAAYGHGGVEPTVTDANVVLGRLDRDYFLGGAMALDDQAAGVAIGRLAEGLGLDEREAAAGVLAIVNANMANAISSRTVQKGVDPRDFSLVAFGGAGPLHAVEVAALIGIPEVIVPPFPGINSAVGLLTTELRYDAVRTQFQVSGALDLERLNGDLATVEAGIAEQFRDDGVDRSEVEFERMGDLPLRRSGLRAAGAVSSRNDRAGAVRGSVPAVPRAAPRGVRPRLRGQPDRDRERAGGRRRTHAHHRRAPPNRRRIPRSGANPHRSRNVPNRRRRARRHRHRLLSPRPPPGRRFVPRPGRGPAARLDDGRPARQRRARGRRGQSRHYR